MFSVQRHDDGLPAAVVHLCAPYTEYRFHLATQLNRTNGVTSTIAPQNQA